MAATGDFSNRMYSRPGPGAGHSRNGQATYLYGDGGVEKNDDKPHPRTERRCRHGEDLMQGSVDPGTRVTAVATPDGKRPAVRFMVLCRLR